MVRPRLHPGLRRPPEPYLGPYAALFLVHPDIETKSAFAPLLYFSSYFLIFILFNCHFFDSANHLGSSLFSHYRSHLLLGLPPWSLPPPAPPDLMDPPPTGLLAGSTAPPPREAVFNPYRLPVSPPPGNIRPQPHRQPELLWLHWMVCLAAWTTEALCAHPMMSQEVPPAQYFETVSARNIYIQTRRAVHEFNILQRRIARGVPSPDATTTFGIYRVNPNGFIRALGTPEDNFALGTAADEALLARRQSHRIYDSNSPPESPPTPALQLHHHHTCPLSLAYTTTQSYPPPT